MNESFVAIGRGSLYPEYTRRKTMAETAAPPPQEKDQNLLAAKGESNAGKKLDRPPTIDKIRETLKKITRSKPKGKDQEQLRKSAEEALRHKHAEYVGRHAQHQVPEAMRKPEFESVQVVSETKVGILPIRVYRKPDGVLVLSSSPRYSRETMQQILKDAGVEIELHKDWDNLTTPQRIEFLKGKGMESLVALRMQEEGVAEAEDERGVQAQPQAEEGRWGEEHLRQIRETFRQLLNLVSQGQTTGVDWDTQRAALDQIIGEFREHVAQRHFREIYEFSKILDDTEKLLRHQFPGEAEAQRTQRSQVLNSILAEPVRVEVRNALSTTDQYFEQMDMAMGDNTRQIILGDLELEIQNAIDQLRIGLRPDQFRARVFAKVRDSRYPEPEWAQGIRNWRATKEVDGVENRLGIELLTQPPARWQEVPEQLANIYRFIEATDFTVEQLSAEVQKALRMIETVQRNQPEGRELLTRLNKELKAFQAFHSFRVTMERANMNPEKVTGIFENYFDNDTWKNFVGRFGKDSRGREFIRHVTDGEGISKAETVNLFDVAEQAYLERLQQERRKMTLLEGLTTVGIEGALNDSDYRTIEKALDISLTDADKATLKQLRQQLVGRFQKKLDDDPKFTLENWGKDVDKTKTVISEWYKQETLLGALGSLKGKREQMRNLLKERLAGLLVRRDEKDTDLAGHRTVDLAELVTSGYLESVDYNAYHFAWTMAWSDHDVIRIYGRDAAGKDDPMIKAIVYNESSFMFFGRHLDHIWEFFTDEKRGRPGREDEVNEIIRKKFPGKYHGLFEGNRTMVRFAKLFMTDEQKKKMFDSGGEINRRVQALMKKWDFEPPDKSDPTLNDGFTEWAERIVIGEMIDKGELDFSQQKFSESAAKIENAQYLMTDLFYDRAFTVKYLNKANFQYYLADPTSENFKRINNTASEYYSGRKIRLWPWMTSAFRAHWEVENKHMRRIFGKPNLKAAEGETLIDDFVGAGNMHKEQGAHEKRRLFGFREVGGRLKIGELEVLGGREFKIPLPAFFGTTPFRAVRRNLESKRRTGWNTAWALLPAIFAGLTVGTFELIKQIPKQAFEGAGGR